MSETRAAPALDTARFVSPATMPQRDQLLRIRMHLSDRSLVAPGC